MNPRYRKIRKRIERKKKRFPLAGRLLLVLCLLLSLPIGGLLMNRPHLNDQVVAANGSTLESPQSSSLSEVQTPASSISPQSVSSSLSSHAQSSFQDRKTESSNPESSAAPKNLQGSLFIGDSRTEGLSVYFDLPDATFYAHKGLTVKSIFTQPFLQDKGETITVLEALSRHRFTRIYIMLGINELGWTYSSVFAQQYEKLVEEVRSLQPEAEITIQSILPVSQKKSSGDPYINNTKIQSYNQLLKQIAKKWNVSYLPVDEKLMDENGCLPEEASVDGVHLNQTYCLKWAAAIEADLTK